MFYTVKFAHKCSVQNFIGHFLLLMIASLETRRFRFRNFCHCVYYYYYYYGASLKVIMLPIATDVTAAACYLPVCVSVTLVRPDKVVGRNEMPFGRDSCEVVVPPREGEIMGSEPPTCIAKTNIECGDAD